MMQRPSFACSRFVQRCAVIALGLGCVGEARANGLIIGKTPSRPLWHHVPRPRPIHKWMPFRIKHQRVDIVINDAVAETEIEQVFVNQSRSVMEGTYLFPVAENVGVHRFSMWMNGREVTGEVLDADRARRIYQSIVSKMRDPGLLQFAGRGLIQAKVFPIPAGGECRIRLRYVEPIAIDAGLASYRFPLGAQGCRFQPIDRFSLKAVIRSSRPLASVFCPSHQCSIDRRGDREAIVGLEKARLQPEDDFQLLYGFGGEAFGLAVLTHREVAGDGFFMARLTPTLASSKDGAMPKNICFVLDTSGSMADDNKIAQAKKALKFCITNLHRADRFNIITFATEIRAFREDWSGADESAKSAARSFINDLGAVGGTDIHAALQRALGLNPSTGKRDEAPWRNHPYFIVFITDGEPTVGLTDPGAILKQVEAQNSRQDARIFVMGVGHRVNTKLLDRLADDNGGARSYVTPNEDLELKISGFYKKLAHPMLADVKLAFRGVSVHDLYPRRLPDLFQGSELVVLGRYGRVEKGRPQIELSGRYRGEPRRFVFDSDFAGDGSRTEFLPRLWAMRKIGFLLDELRLRGNHRELKDEVVRLAKRYGILTPYTSFLVQEDEKLAVRDGRAPIGPRPMAKAAAGYFADNQAELDEAEEAQDASTGEKSVAASKENLSLRQAPAAATQGRFRRAAGKMRDRAGQRLLNVIGAKTFYWEDGRWVDANYDGRTETIKLPVYGEEYECFLAANAKAGRYLAQGSRVVLNWNGRSYETVAAGATQAPGG